MKSITLTEYTQFKTRTVIKAIIETVNPNGPGLGISQMRSRMKLLDKLDAAAGDLELEDADHQELLALLREFRFGAVHPELLLITDAIEGASSPEA